MILSAEGLSKTFIVDPVLEGINIRIEDRDRIGLVGINGSGKTTLLRLLTGQSAPTTGTVSPKDGVSIGYLQQNSGLDNSNTIWQEMLDVFAATLAIQKRMEVLQLAMGESHLAGDQPLYQAQAEEYAQLDEQFSKADGYLVEVKIRRILGGMGFSDKSAETVIQTLSGGEKTRLAIAKLLLEEPDFLILDEPTNHLDFKTLSWLEEYLVGYKGALLVVSHDRYFLDKLVGTIWELERTHLTVYRGNYTKYAALKREALAQQQKEYDMQQKVIADMEDFVNRNLVRASTTKRAQSRIAALERMDRVERPYYENRRAHIQFTYEREPVREVLVVSNLSLSVGEPPARKELFRGFDFTLHRGEKVAIIGANGAGKTSFLKAVLGKIPKDSGEIYWGRNTDTAYFEQELTGLNPANTALDELWNRYPALSQFEIRSALGAVLLTQEAVFKPISVLSGGERAKVAFAILMLRHANVLVLDEPTNHLDLAAKEALEEALEAYTGTLLMISHDRYMLNRVPERIVEFSHTDIHIYPGNYESYLAATQGPADPAAPREPAKKQKEEKTAAGNYRTREQKNALAQYRIRLAQAEKQIRTLEEEIARLEGEIALPEVASDYQGLAERCNQLDDYKKQLADAEETWLALEAKKEENPFLQEGNRL